MVHRIRRTTGKLALAAATPAGELPDNLEVFNETGRTSGRDP
jgi:hypothetical protein